MFFREVTDRSGKRWSIWEVRPTKESPLAPVHRTLGTVAHAHRDAFDHDEHVPPELIEGWLAMQSDGQLRRLSPIPMNWQHLSDECLLALLVEAPLAIVSRPMRR